MAKKVTDKLQEEFRKTFVKLSPFARPVGLSPGTLLEGTKEQKSRVTLFDYKNEKLDMDVLEKPLSLKELRDSETVSWINVEGSEVEVIKQIGDSFGVHPLILEDVVNTGQRPKLEQHENQLFIVVKMLRYEKGSHKLDSEQVGFVLGKHYLISFQEKEGDVFDPVRKRIKAGNARIRKLGPDYLMYALIDAIVDHYFVVLSEIGERIEELEFEMLEDSGRDMPIEVHQLKRHMLFIRKSIWPLKEVTNQLQKDEFEEIDSGTQVYFRDVYDHNVQAGEMIETLQETLKSILDMHLSYASHRMNEIMKVLTIFAAIFIPLTFVAGIYGMNFEVIPELKWEYGYVYVWSLMITLAVGMLWYFRKQKWL